MSRERWKRGAQLPNRYWWLACRWIKAQGECGTGQTDFRKFEIDDNALQLSVYLKQGGKFTEVIVDHRSGFIKMAEANSDGNDLKAANTQSQAIMKTKVLLDKADMDSVTANPGYGAASVMPTLLSPPQTEIAPMKRTETGKEYQPLD